MAKRLPEGISLRHARSCPSRSGGRCRCAPTYQAQAWSPRDRKRLTRTFPTLAAARGWRRRARMQRRSAGVLTALEPDGYLVLHDVTLPGWPPSLDHLVVGVHRALGDQVVAGACVTGNASASGRACTRCCWTSSAATASSTGRGPAWTA